MSSEKTCGIGLGQAIDLEVFIHKRSEKNFGKWILLIVGFAMFVFLMGGCSYGSALTTSEQEACNQYSDGISQFKTDVGNRDLHAFSNLASVANQASLNASNLLKDQLRTQQSDLDAIVGSIGDKNLYNTAVSQWEKDLKDVANHCNSKAFILGG